MLCACLTKVREFEAQKRGQKLVQEVQEFTDLLFFQNLPKSWELSIKQVLPSSSSWKICLLHILFLYRHGLHWRITDQPGWSSVPRSLLGLGTWQRQSRRLWSTAHPRSLFTSGQTKEISEECRENSKRKKLLGKRYGTARKCGNWSSLRCLWLACPATCSETSSLCGWSWDWRYANNTLLSQYLDTFWSAEHRPQRMETLGLDSVDCNWTATAQSRKNPSKQLCFGPKNLNETKKFPQNCYPCFFLVFCVLKR